MRLPDIQALEDLVGAKDIQHGSYYHIGDFLFVRTFDHWMLMPLMYPLLDFTAFGSTVEETVVSMCKLLQAHFEAADTMLLDEKPVSFWEECKYQVILAKEELYSLWKGKRTVVKSS